MAWQPVRGRCSVSGVVIFYGVPLSGTFGDGQRIQKLRNEYSTDNNSNPMSECFFSSVANIYFCSHKCAVKFN